MIKLRNASAPSLEEVERMIEMISKKYSIVLHGPAIYTGSQYRQQYLIQSPINAPQKEKVTRSKSKKTEMKTIKER